MKRQPSFSQPESKKHANGLVQVTAEEFVVLHPISSVERRSTIINSCIRWNMLDRDKIVKALQNEVVVDDYMFRQTSIKGQMFLPLIDWLVDLTSMFSLGVECLFITCQTLDLYLAKQTICLEDFQAIGAGCFLLGSKLEHPSSTPSILALSNLSDGSFTASQLVEIEKKILSTLDYSIGMPNAINFLQVFMDGLAPFSQVNDLAQCGYFLLEVSLHFVELRTTFPSVLAMSCTKLTFIIYQLDELETCFSAVEVEKTMEIVRNCVITYLSQLDFQAVCQRYKDVASLITLNLLDKRWEEGKES